VFGKARVQGRKAAVARKMIEDALALEVAGAFAVVLELVPAPLAGAISRRLRIPTIGIGAGPECDGQVLIIHDVLGLNPDFMPRLAKRYVDLGSIIREATTTYINEVTSRAFPDEQHSSTMDEAVLREALEGLE
jgi:3-methyl-2-oxobutanoate hydroxymethyltransferase